MEQRLKNKKGTIKKSQEKIGKVLIAREWGVSD